MTVEYANTNSRPARVRRPWAEEERLLRRYGAPEAMIGRLREKRMKREADHAAREARLAAAELRAGVTRWVVRR